MGNRPMRGRLVAAQETGGSKHQSARAHARHVTGVGPAVGQEVEDRGVHHAGDRTHQPARQEEHVEVARTLVDGAGRGDRQA